MSLRLWFGQKLLCVALRVSATFVCKFVRGLCAWCCIVLLVLRRSSLLCIAMHESAHLYHNLPSITTAVFFCVVYECLSLFACGYSVSCNFVLLCCA